MFYLILPECINAYHKANHVLPARIIMYRDGVGDGQLTYVKETELKEILVSVLCVSQIIITNTNHKY